MIFSDSFLLIATIVSLLYKRTGCFFLILYDLNPAPYGKPDRSDPALEMTAPGNYCNRPAGASA